MQMVHPLHCHFQFFKIFFSLSMNVLDCSVRLCFVQFRFYLRFLFDFWVFRTDLSCGITQVEVVQGEFRRASQNKELGVFLLEGSSPGLLFLTDSSYNSILFVRNFSSSSWNSSN